MDKFKVNCLRLLTLILLLCCGSAMAQKVVIKGSVTDKDTGAPLAFAHVFVQSKSMGTVSNAQGIFEFKVKNPSPEDSLVISSVGYANYVVPVIGLPPNLEVALKRDIIILEEIVVNEQELTADEILNAAVDNLLKNQTYPNTPFQLEGFFRQVFEKDSMNMAVFEAAFNAYDKTSTKPINKIEIVQARKLESEEYKKYGSILANRNFLEMLLGTSVNFNILARNGLKGGKTAWAIGKRPYTKELSTYNNKVVYIIRHENSTVSMELIIDAKDFSVMRNEYRSKQSPEEYEEFYWKFSIGENSACGYFSTHQIYEYREFDGLVYPSFFYRGEEARCYNKKTGEFMNENKRYFQALFNDIKTEVEIPKTANIKKHKDLTELSFDYDPDFWANYNLISELPMSEEVIRDLGTWNDQN